MARYWPEPSDVAYSDGIHTGEARGTLLSPPRGWPELFSSSSALKAFLGKRGLQGKRCRLTDAPLGDSLAAAAAAGVTLSPDDPFGNAVALRDRLGWEMIEGFAIFEVDGSNSSSGQPLWAAHKRWWNAKGGKKWEDLTPRPGGLEAIVLLESRLASKSLEPPTGAARLAAAVQRHKLGGLCSPVPIGRQQPEAATWSEDGRHEPATDGGGCAERADDDIPPALQAALALLPALSDPPLLPDAPSSASAPGALPPARASRNAGTTLMQELGVVGSHRPTKRPL